MHVSGILTAAIHCTLGVPSEGAHVLILEGAVEGCQFTQLIAFVLHAGLILGLQEIFYHLCCPVYVLLNTNTFDTIPQRITRSCQCLQEQHRLQYSDI